MRLEHTFLRSPWPLHSQLTLQPVPITQSLEVTDMWHSVPKCLFSFSTKWFPSFYLVPFNYSSTHHIKVWDTLSLPSCRCYKEFLPPQNSWFIHLIIVNSEAIRAATVVGPGPWIQRKYGLSLVSRSIWQLVIAAEQWKDLQKVTFSILVLRWQWSWASQQRRNGLKMFSSQMVHLSSLCPAHSAICRCPHSEPASSCLPAGKNPLTQSYCNRAPNSCLFCASVHSTRVHCTHMV